MLFARRPEEPARTRPAGIDERQNGNCDDTAAVEIGFKAIKAELIWRRPWQTRLQAETANFQYIKGFHNPRHRHLALRGKALGPSSAKRPERVLGTA